MNSSKVSENKNNHNEELKTIIIRIDEIVESTKKNRRFIKWDYPIEQSIVIEKTQYVKYCADCDNTLSVINPSDYCSKSCEKNFLDELEHTKSMLESGEIDLWKDDDNEEKESEDEGEEEPVKKKTVRKSTKKK